MRLPQKRIAVRGAYSGKKWHDKVDAMSDEQIIAIYNRLKNQGVLK
jgi:hypothetical protein